MRGTRGRLPRLTHADRVKRREARDARAERTGNIRDVYHQPPAVRQRLLLEKTRAALSRAIRHRASSEHQQARGAYAQRVRSLKALLDRMGGAR